LKSDEIERGVLVGREAPDFTAAAVLGNGEIVDGFNFKSTTKGNTAVVFFTRLILHLYVRQS